jgi:anti-sigma factor RsiW
VTSVSMTCGRTRRLLWPGARPRTASAEVIEAQRHLEACSVCQQFMREMLALGDAIHDAAAREYAPPDVRGRLFGAIARARTGTQQTTSGRHRRVQWLAAAVVLLIGLAGVVTADRLLRDATADPITAIVEDHARALSESRIASRDLADITRWLASQLHFAMYVPVLTGAELRGARLCVLDGQRGAVVEYEADGVTLSYFVVPYGVEPAAGATPGRFDRSRRAGYQVVSWRERGFLHAMVGNLPESRLTAFAKACVEQARRVVVWLRGRADPQKEG